MKNAKSAAAGALTAIAVYLVLLAVVSALTVKGVIPERALELSIRAAAFASAFAGTAAALKGREGFAAAVCPTVFYLTVLLLGFLAGDGLNGELAAKLALPVALGAATAYMTMRKTKDTRPRKPARRKVNIKRKTQT